MSVPEPVARAAAPPYLNEGPHALWHFSEDPNIDVFQPHRAATSERSDQLVWAVDTRHAPLFWFPRDCPRGCAWIAPTTNAADRTQFFGHVDSQRIHLMEAAWLARVQRCRLFAYQLPEASFQPDQQVGGYWTSRESVQPLALVEVGDLLDQHARSGIELRIVPSLWPWWAAVIRSTLEFSGSRLSNCTVAEPEWVRR